MHRIEADLLIPGRGGPVSVMPSQAASKLTPTPLAPRLVPNSFKLIFDWYQRNSGLGAVGFALIPCPVPPGSCKPARTNGKQPAFSA